METRTRRRGHRRDGLIGFGVEATDGKVGTVIHAGRTVDGLRYLVVDTGSWIFGKHVMVPTDSVSRIDRARSLVLVDRTRDQIKDAPDFDGVVRLPGTDPLDRVSSYSRIYGRICGSGRL
jgi:hypothetical protein